jgi:hypothetical protein
MTLQSSRHRIIKILAHKKQLSQVVRFLSNISPQLANIAAIVDSETISPGGERLLD